jgi:hypothetical protein
MVISNTPGLLGVALAVVFGMWLDSLLPVPPPGLEDLAIHAGALFLGLFALTVDRCEVPGLLASYRANLQNVTAAVEGMFGDKVAVVPGRRLTFFVIPLVLVPLIPLLVGLGVVAFELGTNGTLTRLDRFRHLDLPLAGIAIWACYALATRSLRLRVRPSTRESVGL